jgi:exodeoxyribonuclease V beta subunit
MKASAPKPNPLQNRHRVMKTNKPSLNPLTLPFTGSHLIEASAGTGKTFTIAALYIRLILGHGGGQAFREGRALTPPEILVVTFTDAATQELRDRIRARLAKAALYFREKPEAILPLPRGEDFLYDLRADYEPSQWPACAHKLQLASEWMDEAAVSTIHSWCNRMLREHAFDSQSLFTQTLKTDQSALFSEMVRHYWRNHFYPLSAEAIEQVLAFWSHPRDLEAAIKPLIEHVNLLEPYPEPAVHLATTDQDKKALLAELKEPWEHWPGEIRALFEQAKQKKLIDGRKLQARWYEPWLERLEAWAQSPTEELLELDTGWWRLSTEGIREAWKNGEPPAHAAFAEISALKDALTQLPNSRLGILSHAARWVAEEFASTQTRRAEMGFDDLLTGLKAALASDQGHRLAQVIRQQFPVALIDEFQDTDPVQYRIFEHIYEVSQPRPDSALILIGDPKQAIYAFRGADIHTYLKARKAVQSRLHTLDTNYRSTQAMVDAVNHCFAYRETLADGAGAFLFRNNDQNPLPFLSVKAKGQESHFKVLDQEVPALTLAVLPAEEVLSKSAYLEQMAQICATQLVAWLNLGQQNRAGFIDTEGVRVPIKPGDIAILVNNRNEATCIRQALSQRGVRSVYLSDKDSVYASRAASEIYRWLLACAEPDNDRFVRAALSTAVLGLSFAELEALNQEEETWESWILQFKGYRDIWQRQGVLPMLRTILFDFGCMARLSPLPADATGVSGERLLTDILHLAELLQHASYALEGEYALIRFLAEQQASPSEDSEVKKVRLESDADLVKVVTIHKSKGLEYPVVFLPFICATRPVKTTDIPLTWHTDDGEFQISLAASPEVLQRADHDRLGEDLRKVYVALTRARYATWLGLAPLESAETSAIGYLLGMDPAMPGTLVNALQSFADGEPAIAVDSEARINADRFITLEAQSTSGKARVPRQVARAYWGVRSYSSLRTESLGPGDSAASVIDDTAQVENLREGEQQILPLVNPQDRSDGALHRFYKGAEAGTFLHELLEWTGNVGFGAILENSAPLQDVIARRCTLRGWETQAECLHQWITMILETPLPIGGQNPQSGDGPETIALKDLQTYKVEMEFWFETHQVDLESLDAAMMSYTLAQRPRPKLLPETLNGMLKGFIDLVFEYQGKYYIADYKSNWLGPRNANYSQSAIEEAILGHRYDLQYGIYLFALHRLLQSRLPDYDYDTHIGGALYIFLRGIGTETGGVHYDRPPKVLIETLEGLFSHHLRSAA